MFITLISVCILLGYSVFHRSTKQHKWFYFKNFIADLLRDAGIARYYQTLNTVMFLYFCHIVYTVVNLLLPSQGENC